MFDANGTHLMQKIISNFSEDKLDIIYQQIKSNFFELVTDKAGVCSIKTLIEKLSEEKHMEKMNEIYMCILLNFYEIIQDSYGNYAIKKLIESNSMIKGLERPLISKLLEKFCNLAS